MRLIITTELRREPATTLKALQAAEGESPVGRWVTANVDLKTIVAVLAMVVTLVGLHTATTNHLASLDSDMRDVKAQAHDNTDRIARANARINSETVSLQTYANATAQLNLTLGMLANGQQQIYAKLLQETPMRSYPQPVAPIPLLRPER